MSSFGKSPTRKRTKRKVKPEKRRGAGGTTVRVLSVKAIRNLPRVANGGTANCGFCWTYLVAFAWPSGLHFPHNPKVGGSNPPPATNFFSDLEAPVIWRFLLLSVICPCPQSECVDSGQRPLRDTRGTSEMSISGASRCLASSVLIPPKSAGIFLCAIARFE
jgi:hypothetical protein